MRYLLTLLVLAAVATADEKTEIQKLHTELAKLHDKVDALTQGLQKSMALNQTLMEHNKALEAQSAQARARLAQVVEASKQQLAVMEELRKAMATAHAANGRMMEQLTRYSTRAQPAYKNTEFLVRHVLRVAIADYRAETRRLPRALWPALGEEGRARPLRAVDLPSPSMLAMGKLVDGWGNPIIYIHKNDYGKAHTVTMADGRRVTVRARKKPDGVFENPTSYQMYSCGPNGKPGDADDIG